MDNVKQLIPANLDQYQMDNMTFDVAKQAWRVSVVDGITLNVDKVNISGNGNISGELKVVTVPEIIRQSEVHQVNVPVIIKEIQIVEVPKIVTEYKTIEIPVVIREVQVVEIEKPIVVKETEFKELSTFVKVCMIVQCLATVGLLITHIMKGM